MRALLTLRKFSRTVIIFIIAIAVVKIAFN